MFIPWSNYAEHKAQLRRSLLFKLARSAYSASLRWAEPYTEELRLWRRVCSSSSMSCANAISGRGRRHLQEKPQGTYFTRTSEPYCELLLSWIRSQSRSMSPLFLYSYNQTQGIWYEARAERTVVHFLARAVWKAHQYICRALRSSTI